MVLYQLKRVKDWAGHLIRLYSWFLKAGLTDDGRICSMGSKKWSWSWLGIYTELWILSSLRNGAEESSANKKAGCHLIKFLYTNHLYRMKIEYSSWFISCPVCCVLYQVSSFSCSASKMSCTKEYSSCFHFRSKKYKVCKSPLGLPGGRPTGSRGYSVGQSGCNTTASV